jgi:hypothetical protein
MNRSDRVRPLIATNCKVVPRPEFRCCKKQRINPDFNGDALGAVAMTHFPPVSRPALARWLFERDLSYADAAAHLGCSTEMVRLLCQPFGDPDRRVPGPGLMRKIIALTAGEIDPNSFYGMKAGDELGAPDRSEAA